MAMKILLVEDNPSLTRMYKIAFRGRMPDAQLDSVVSVGGYLRTAAEKKYDAYILDDAIADGRSAFLEIAPLIAERFPGATLLHNSANTHPPDISKAERLAGIRFARGPGGEVLACNKDPMLTIEHIRSMLVQKESRAQSLRAPACQLLRPKHEAHPKSAFVCCRQ